VRLCAVSHGSLCALATVTVVRFSWFRALRIVSWDAMVTANAAACQYPPPQYAPSHAGGGPPEEALTLPIMAG
jgi:hypothetical protein